MARCDVCGNEYDQSFVMTGAGGTQTTFNSFERAIHRLAPHGHRARRRGRRANRLLQPLRLGGKLT
jgi:hypothetical protein